MVGGDIEAIELGRGRDVREELYELHRVARADVCNLEILLLGGNAGAEHIFEAVEPEPVLKHKASGVLVAATEHVVVVVLRCHA